MHMTGLVVVCNEVIKLGWYNGKMRGNTLRYTYGLSEEISEGWMGIWSYGGIVDGKKYNNLAGSSLGDSLGSEIVTDVGSCDGNVDGNDDVNSSVHNLESR